MTTETQGLETEWLLLQNQFDAYEKYSLVIKLVSVIVLCAFYWLNSVTAFAVMILLILWLQDAIWKTFQSRITPRLLMLEQAMRVEHTQEKAAEDNPTVLPCQFNSQYALSRPSQRGLIKEYGLQALRPTVAFPHGVLVVLAIMMFIVTA